MTVAAADSKLEQQPKQRKSWKRWIFLTLLLLAGVLVAARLAMPSFIRWYVNRVIDQSPLYDGSIGGVRVSLYRGAYSIEEIRLVKTTGNVPVPFFAAKRLDLAVQWDALRAGKIVGTIVMHQPELNFVDSENPSEDQTGGSAPWLDMLRSLFPFRINSMKIEDGSIHFRAFDKDPPVDVYLTNLDATIENVTNIRDETTPLIATVSATGLAMDSARLEYEMKFDPFSYRPTFQTALRLIGLDVTKTNALARAYGAFDFEGGWFDLVVELDAKEGYLEGYVKPLFRDLKVLSLKQDVQEDNVLAVFWEALVGTATELFKNQRRDQLGTVIELSGDLTNPDRNILEILGNVLHNAFVRAYLPRLEGVADVDGLQFSPGSVSDPVSAGDKE